MKKVLLGLVASICLVTSIAYAASISASGTGPSMTQKGAAYTLTLSPTGAPALDTPATTISWAWTVNTGTCMNGIQIPAPCPLPTNFRVRLCWHQSGDGIFFIDPNDPNQCKIITNQFSGSTSQWQGYLFNGVNKTLKMKMIFDANGSGAISPAITTQGSVTVNY
jgi:hypothetical protein